MASAARENLETVRRAYDAINRRDIEAALDCFHDDAEHDWSHSVGPDRGIYRGREEARHFWTNAFEAVDATFELEDIVAEGPHVVVMVSAHIRGSGSGAEGVGRSPHVWTLQDGRATRFQLFQTWEEALAAAGAKG